MADQVAASAADLGELRWDGEDGWLIAGEGTHVRSLPLKSRAFRRWLIRRLHDVGEKSPSNSTQWAQVTEQLEARAERNGTGTAPSIRVTKGADALYMDLGRDDFACARITAEGWSIVPHPVAGPYFYRPGRMAALPIPVSGGSPDLLFEYISVHESAQRLVLAWLVQASRARGPYPILPVTGSTGASKTTIISALKALIDPTLSSEETPALTSPRKPPRDEADILTAARNNWVVGFDNISWIDLWMSDALCRLATGAELGGRAYYTNFDEAVFVACRPIVLNGIVDVVKQPDLADRCVRIEAVKPKVRIPESKYWQRFENDWPVLLGVLLDLISASMRHWTEAGRRTPEDADIRFRDHARIGESLGVEFGWPSGSFTDLYSENLRTAASGIADDDPITEPLHAVLDAEGGSWTGTNKMLLGKLIHHVGGDGPDAHLVSAEIRKGKDWPTGALALSNKLARLAPALEAQGITVGKVRRSDGKSVRTIAKSALPGFGSAL